jgi:hypothetical protein
VARASCSYACSYCYLLVCENINTGKIKASVPNLLCFNFLPEYNFEVTVIAKYLKGRRTCCLHVHVCNAICLPVEWRDINTCLFSPEFVSRPTSLLESNRFFSVFYIVIRFWPNKFTSSGNIIPLQSPLLFLSLPNGIFWITL